MENITFTQIVHSRESLDAQGNIFRMGHVPERGKTSGGGGGGGGERGKTTGGEGGGL